MARRFVLSSLFAFEYVSAITTITSTPSPAPSSAGWWNDDFVEIDGNSNNGSADAWFTGAAFGDLGDISTCDVCFPNSWDNSDIVHGWWANEHNNQGFQLSRLFQCTSHSIVEYEFYIYFCVEFGDNDEFYVDRLPDFSLGNQNENFVVTSASVNENDPKNVLGSNGNQPGSTCSASIKYYYFNDSFETKPYTLNSITVRNENLNGDDNVIAFNNFRMRCITKSTPNPIPIPTSSPTTSKPSISPTTSEPSLPSICVEPVNSTTFESPSHNLDCDNDGNCTCTSSEQLDILFGVDTSGSIGLSGFRIQKQFIENMALSGINHNVSRIGFTMFNTYVNESRSLQFWDQDELVLYINGLYWTSGWTNTPALIDSALTTFYNQSDESRQSILFMITDGDPCSPDDQGGCPQSVCQYSTQIQSMGIRVVIVGIGDGLSEDYIGCLAKDGDFIPVDDFDEVDLGVLCSAEPTPQPMPSLSIPPMPDFVYPGLELSYDEANEYCKQCHGTELVTIDDDIEFRQEIIDVIGDEKIWFGLHSKDGNQWRFLNKDDECTNINTRYKCTDFWSYRLNGNTKYRPRCLGPTEGGEYCSYFDGGSNTADNDISCHTQMLFLCNGPE